MAATSSSRFISVAPQPQSSLASLPDELILQIVLRIRDTATLRSLWQTCTHFASLSLAPAFVHENTDQFFVEQCALLHALAVPDRLARVYQIACRTAKVIQPSHLQRMLACLEFPGESDASSQDADSAAKENTGAKRAATFARAIIGAAICSGRVEGFNDGVKQYAMELMDGIPWESVARTSGSLPLLTANASQVPLSVDALFGIWARISTAIASSTNPLMKCCLAAYMLSSAAPLPMTFKLPLLKGIMQSGVMQVSSMARVPVVISLERSADYAETLSVSLAEGFFGMLGEVLDALIEREDEVSDRHLMFAKMLPSVPWQENSQRALDWLMKALPRNPNGFSLEMLPVGIFSDKEIDYLAQSLSDGSFSRDALAEIDPAGVGK